jgi:hypothetical protein
MKKLLVLFLLLSGMGFGQQTTINGSEHPELIPDSAAARAVFNVHSMFGSPADTANTEKQHAKLNLSPADHAIYDAAMQAHFNNKRRNSSATMAGLLSTLSPDGKAKLLAFIQAEKKGMQYHTQPAVAQ